MAITQAVCNSWKVESMQGIHDFDPGDDQLKIALYLSTADLSKDTTVYTATGETSGAGYAAGGANITVTTGYPQLEGDSGSLRFETVSWPSATFTCRGALVYNSTKANRAVMVLDFGADTGPSAGTFTIQFPPGGDPILRIT